MGSNNFTFEATVDSPGDVGEGNVGSLDGQQPIEVIVERSSLLKFQDMRVQSLNGESRRPRLLIRPVSLSCVAGLCRFSLEEYSSAVW